MKKAALHNLGCKVNAYETEAMGQLLEEAGYMLVPFTEEADVYIINTCSVTNMADRKSRQMLHRAKAKNPNAIIVAAGCYVQTKTEEVKQDTAVDLIIGNNKKHELVELLEQAFAQREAKQESKEAQKGQLEAVIDINEKGQPFEMLNLSNTVDHTRAFLKVQDGCNQFCSYCIIPYARGRVRSKNLEEVIKEIEGLAAKGYKEVVLTGIHLSSYGVDNGESLLGLIKRVHEIAGIERIRLGSLEPKIVTEEFARELSEMNKICPHFHLSLQSGCDETLRRMNRKYTTAEYEEGCQMLRKYFTHPAITTDVIVGFPGETEEEFAKTKEFLQRIHFYEMHIFKYSVRQGTRAATMEHQIPEEIKTQRSNELLAMEAKMSEEFRSYYKNRTEEVLIEEEVVIDEKPYYVGYTKEYVKVAVTKQQNQTEDLCNNMVDVNLAFLESGLFFASV